MAQPLEVKAILCDVNGTLFSLDALGARMQQVGLQKTDLQVRHVSTHLFSLHRHFETFSDLFFVRYVLHSMHELSATASSTECKMQLWFTAVLRDGIATAASGCFAPFKEIGSHHLLSMLRKAGVSGDHSKAVQTVLGGFNEAEVFNDVSPAFKRIHAKGIQVTHK